MVAGASIFLMTVEAPLTVLGPVVARDSYDGARTWGFLAAGMGVGQIIGGVVALRWRPRRPFLVLACGMSLTALPMAALATTAPVWALLGSAAVLGVVWGMFDPFWLTVMQREVPPDMISRVSSYDYLGSLAFYPAGLALAGPVAGLIGVPATLWAERRDGDRGEPVLALVAGRARRASTWGRRGPQRPTDQALRRSYSARPVASHSR